MTGAVSAVHEGFEFQALQFWMQAVRLLDPASNVVEVGFECGPKGFDDLWTAFDPSHPPLDHDGVPYGLEYSQCKWHVWNGHYGHVELTDPKFINATNHSFLQRAHDAYGIHGSGLRRVRFKLLTNWHVSPDDALWPMIHRGSARLSEAKLFAGATTRSASGRLRKVWADHLGIDEGRLRGFASSLVFAEVRESLEEQRLHLHYRLKAVGLRGARPGEIATDYEQIPFKWLGQGRQKFDRHSFRALCQEQRLVESTPKVRVSFGVKSFEHSIDRLDDRCDKTLDLVHHFDDRRILQSERWAQSVYPELAAFLKQAAVQNDSLRLALDAHATLAFAAGSVLDIKASRPVEIEQRGRQREIWEANDAQGKKDWPQWQFEKSRCSGGGEDLAVAVALTHAITEEVNNYVNQHLPQVGTLLVAAPVGGSGPHSVACGSHAFELARTLAYQARKERVNANACVHIFVAGPNAFTFFLGQHQRMLGKCALYEYDFEGQEGGGYTESLRFPIVPAPIAA